MRNCVVCGKETSGAYGGDSIPACYECYESGKLADWLEGRIYEFEMGNTASIDGTESTVRDFSKHVKSKNAVGHQKHCLGGDDIGR